MTVSTQVNLVRRPDGWPVADDFLLVEVELPALAAGEVRVANEFVSVDPYMRGRMDDVPSYVAPYALGEAMAGRAIGRVIASESPVLPVGSVVVHQLAWRDIAQADAAGFTPVRELDGVPLSAHMGILGMTGLTAWIGLVEICRLQPGQSIFVSGAAGAVGSAAGQFARLLGASRVIGSAGTAGKVARVVGAYGYDAAFNYRDAPVREQLAAMAPDGIDHYFDNVGGDHLEAAIDVLAVGGRAALCGAITAYNENGVVAGPDNLDRLITRALTLQGYRLGDHLHRYPEFLEVASGWVQRGDAVQDETIHDGIGSAVDAFLGMMRGESVGKTLVRP